MKPPNVQAELNGFGTWDNASSELNQPLFSRVWAMPSKDTFSVKPIADFVHRYLDKSTISVDPFARNKRWANYTNDLNPETEAEYHMDAEDFCVMLARKYIKADLVIFDPPYSIHQIVTTYKQFGIDRDHKGAHNGALYSRVKTSIPPLLADDAIVLSFGWNSAGLGKKHGFEIIEILLVCHGGAHNDTICIAERRKSYKTSSQVRDEEMEHCASS